MSLNFYYRDIEDWENTCFHPGKDGKMKTVTEGLIWSTIAVGICHITQNNWREYFKRLHSIELASKSYRTKLENKKLVEIFFTPEEVKSHIGLSTNASTTTKREFAELLRKLLIERAEIKLKEFDNSLEKADCEGA